MRNFDQAYIGGRLVRLKGGEKLILVNPATGEPRAAVRLAEERDLERAAAAARSAWPIISDSGLKERADWLNRLSWAVLERLDDLVAMEVEEFGIPVRFGTNRVRAAAAAFVAAAEAMGQFEFQKKSGNSILLWEPRGVAGLITPWNANYTSVCGKLAASLAAGCPAVIKPSELSAGQTALLTECFHQAGLPPGAVNIVPGPGETVGAALVRHPDIPHIFFTGSLETGQSIVRSCADRLKRYTLELGGKSPALILDDADLPRAVHQAVVACFRVNGQTCAAASRVLVPEDRLEEVQAIIRQVISERQPVGPPDDPETIIGPLVSARQQERVRAYIRSGQKEGAEVLIGGEAPPKGLERGFYIRPTVLTGVTSSMKVAREEIFGPVICLMSYRTEEEAVRLANSTDFGLVAYVYSADLQRAASLAAKLEAGTVYINNQASGPGLPFSGRKLSGTGREQGVLGLMEFLETKVICGAEAT